MPKAFCSSCLCDRVIDHKWRAIWIDTDGDLVVSVPSKECDIDFERPGTVFACGEGCALVNHRTLPVHQQPGTAPRRPLQGDCMTATATELTISTIANMLQEPIAGFDNALFESLCADALEAKEQAATAKKNYEDAADRLQLFVDKHGFAPNDADKTVRCISNRYQADVTRAVATEINDDRVVSFQSVLKRARLSALFFLLFTRKVSYSLAPNADKAIAAAIVPKRWREAVFAAYGLCFTPKPKAAALKVTDLDLVAAAEAEKKAAREAKKAAKKGGR